MQAISEPLQTPVGLNNCFNKFVAWFKQVKHSNQSGTENEEKLTYALRLYTNLHKKVLNHLSC